MAIYDRVRFAQRSFDLVRVVGPALFDPCVHGIEVVPGLSVCPRGHSATWDLEPRLTLRELRVRITDDAVLRPIGGRRPARGWRHTQRLVAGRWVFGAWPTWDHVYHGLELVSGFTGSLWLGADRIVGAHVPGEPLLAYRTVWDILVEEGQLTAAIDRSSEVAGARARRRTMPEPEPAVFDRLH